MDAPTREAERARLRDRVGQVRLADRLGYHRWWLGEPHGAGGGRFGSAPETFVAFCSPSTTQIRFGVGIAAGPGCSNHPIRSAERLATLDIVSGGRLDWCAGECAAGPEDARWLERLEIVPRMWQEDVFEHDGEAWQIAPIQVVPKPVQDPYPPVHASARSRAAARRIGELGLGIVWVGADEQCARALEAYREGFEPAEGAPWFSLLLRDPDWDADVLLLHRRIERLGEAGVDEVILDTRKAQGEALEGLAEAAALRSGETSSAVASGVQ